MITEIVRPRIAAEAVKAKTAPGAAYLGGGTWLNSGKAENVTILMSLEMLALDSLRVESGRCIIGASVTFQAIVDSPMAPSALREAALLAASRTLRNRVTLDGELGLRPDDSALIPALIVLEAEVSVAGKKKSIPIPGGAPSGKNPEGSKRGEGGPRPAGCSGTPAAFRGERSQGARGALWWIVSRAPLRGTLGSQHPVSPGARP
jgi:hypothetical protein